MVVSTFSMLNKDDRERFFEESFLLANVKPKINLEMSFLTMNNADVDFQIRNLQWKSYITRDIFLTTKRVELIRKKEFVVATLDPEHEAFIVHVAALSIDLGDEVQPSNRAQVAYLKVDKTSTKVPSKFVDFADVFSPKMAAELPKDTGINDRAIELIDD